MQTIQRNRNDRLISAIREVTTAHELLLRAAGELRAVAGDACNTEASADAGIDVALADAITRSADHLSAVADTLAAAAVHRDSATPRTASTQSA